MNESMNQVDVKFLTADTPHSHTVPSTEKGLDAVIKLCTSPAGGAAPPGGEAGINHHAPQSSLNSTRAAGRPEFLALIDGAPSAF